MSPISSSEFRNYNDDFFGDKKFCDVTLKDTSGEVQIRAHRSVLAAKSEYFSSMFGGFFKEAKSSEVKLDEIDGRTLETVINFIYSNKIELEGNTVEDVLKAANFLQINPLEGECSDYFRKQLDVSNVLSIVFFAEQYSPSYLYDFAFEFACLHFMELRHTEEFFSLEVQQLVKLISSDIICVSSEEEVFHAIWGWIQYDRHNRKQFFFEQLFQHLRLPLLEPKFISSIVKPAIKSSKRLKLVYKSFKWQSPVREHQTKRRSLKDALIVIKGWMGNSSLTFKFYSPASKKWSYREYPGVLEKREAFGYTTLDEKIVSAGGTVDNSAITNRVDCLDLKTFQRTQLLPLLTPRSLCTTASLNGHLYVFRGFNDSGLLSSVEKWDPLIGKWEYITTTSTSLRFPVVGIKGSSLCVSHDTWCGEGILEIYDPLANAWTYEWSRTLNPLRGMATFSINGVDHFFTISETEIKSYNLKNNNTTIIPINCTNSHFTSFAVFNCSLIILTDDGCLRKYCPIKNEWETMANLDKDTCSDLMWISQGI